MQYLRDLLVRLNNKRKKQQLAKTPFFSDTTLKSDVQWLEPLFFGTETLKSMIFSTKNIEESRDLMRRMPNDDYSEFLNKYYDKALNQLGEKWIYADIVTVLNAISKNFDINSYLEIGVRNGRSLLVVANNRPDCNIVGFDLWIEDYAGMDNPGEEYVIEKLSEFNFSGKVDFINGDSKKTVPEYFKENTDAYFDLITVDGDHRIKGAKTDIRNVIKRLKVGGFLVFDDIVSPHHPYLEKLWKKEIKDNDRFTTFEYEDVGLGIGVAIKRY